ncbi:bifunctional adenosylcobinamide kinase/adenosylcobinamide-phosphate guanylyltransferase [Octadecabacter ascidiaceicola]|uniref:Bifunctional adenosylcobalamin biosynthesis protein n=1 Tax=Octadecabacter ascidiaceicola TaxID=1655543 RepID=A0A238K883_9RHOB|nr:bifunctional adenosylcobinamide kinase/adenosylcobinamide-phosphate guanylyltransferase [Octadecabacter ascidiaceicola]SMX39069.1 Bifunctional adenosylcobalamin biosynthesis protein CobP [Octadecabacter ascidiaceicola]
MPLPQFTLVLGGAASGKSSFAEALCFQSTRSRVYIATAQAFDDEMRAKVSAHKAQRGSEWLTIEAPLEIADAISERAEGEVVLLDCATLWLSNVLLAEQDASEATVVLLAAIAACPAQVIVVSNEVGHGIVPDNALARQFRNAQGRLNQSLAARADLVVNVIAGLPQILKGDKDMLT